MDMIILDYIAYLIIIWSCGILIYKILRFFNLFKNQEVKGKNCSGCNSGCEMKESILLNRNKFSSKDQYKFYL